MDSNTNLAVDYYQPNDRIIKNRLKANSLNSHLHKIDRTWLLHAPELSVTTQWFSPKYWREQDKILGESRGRNVTWFVGEKNEPMVLRHYYRGGLIGKLVDDQYWFNGIKNTRAYKEYELLIELEKRQLPACRVVAAHVNNSGLTYRADLLMKMVNGGQDLVALLTKQKLDDTVWQEIGKTIATFHKQHVYHADLNAHNILINKNNKAWLIDFDRGEIKVAQGQWCQDNLNRLLRSFNKELAQLPVFNFTLGNWATLTDAYQQALND